MPYNDFILTWFFSTTNMDWDMDSVKEIRPIWAETYQDPVKRGGKGFLSTCSTYHPRNWITQTLATAGRLTFLAINDFLNFFFIKMFLENMNFNLSQKGFCLTYMPKYTPLRIFKLNQECHTWKFDYRSRRTCSTCIRSMHGQSEEFVEQLSGEQDLMRYFFESVSHMARGRERVAWRFEGMYRTSGKPVNFW